MTLSKKWPVLQAVLIVFLIVEILSRSSAVGPEVKVWDTANDFNTATLSNTTITSGGHATLTGTTGQPASEPLPTYQVTVQPYTYDPGDGVAACHEDYWLLYNSPNTPDIPRSGMSPIRMMHVGGANPHDEWWSLSSIYVPSSGDWPGDGWGNTILDWHNSANDVGNTGDGGVGWGFGSGVSPVLLRLTTLHHTPGDSNTGLILQFENTAQQHWALPDPVPGQWYDITMHIIFGRTDGTTARPGSVQVWVNGQNTPVVNASNLNILQRAQNPTNGIYYTQEWVEFWEGGPYLMGAPCRPEVGAKVWNHDHVITRFGSTLAQAVNDTQLTKITEWGSVHIPGQPNYGDSSASPTASRSTSDFQLPSTLASQLPAGGTTYPSSGTVTLSHDAGGLSDWTGVTNSATTPASTSISYQYRSSVGGDSWTSWYSDIAQVPDGRYIQIKATLSTADATVTPDLDSITLNYDVLPAGTPETPSHLSVQAPTSAQVNLSWAASTSPDIVSYNIYRDGSPTPIANVPVNTVTLGKTAVGANLVDLTADRKRGSAFTATTTADLTKVHVYLAGKGTAGTQAIKAAIYDTSGGVPNNLLGQSNEQLISGIASGSFVDFPLISPVQVTEGETYVLVISSGATNQLVQIATDPTGGIFYNDDTYSDGMNSVFGAATTDSRGMSIYATGTPMATISIGRTNVGPGLGYITKDQKGGSAFTASSTAYLTDVHAYLSGTGTAGTQAIKAAIYDTSGGVPNNLLGQSNEQLISGIASGSFVDFPLISPVQVTEGETYVLVISSGATSRLVQVATESVGGTFYNDDTYSDGLTDPFGSATTSSAGISIYATGFIPMSYIDTTVAAGTSYSYQVTAVNGSDTESGLSSAANISTPASGVDTTDPTISLTSPVSASIIAGHNTIINATASDDIGVVGVQFKVDGSNMGAEDTSYPYSAAWDTTTISEGSHSITAVARDAAGNSATSDAVAVTVDNIAPTVSLSAPTESAYLSGTATISASSSDTNGIAGVQFKLNGANLYSEDPLAPYSVSWDTTSSADGSYTLTAAAYDNARNAATSSSISITVDNTKPAISMAAPTNGSTISGSNVAVTASASDTGGSGVASVQFYLDAPNPITDPSTNKLGAAITNSPYTYSWDTTSLSDGTHTLTSIVTDRAGNTKTAGYITVIVDNTPPAPAVSISASPRTISSGGRSTITWSVSNATSCTASGAWSGAKSTSGSISTGNLTSTKTYTLSCTGPSGTRSASATVTVSSITYAKTDLNKDKKTDIFDLSILLTRYGSTNQSGDIDNNGIINIFDLSMLLSNYGG